MLLDYVTNEQTKANQKAHDPFDTQQINTYQHQVFDALPSFIRVFGIVKGQCRIMLLCIFMCLCLEPLQSQISNNS